MGNIKVLYKIHRCTLLLFIIVNCNYKMTCTCIICYALLVNDKKKKKKL